MPEMLVNQTAPDGLPTGRCYTFPLSNVYGPIDDAKKTGLITRAYANTCSFHLVLDVIAPSVCLSSAGQKVERLRQRGFLG